MEHKLGKDLIEHSPVHSSCLSTLFAICYEQSAYPDFYEDTYKVLIESQQAKIHNQKFSLLFPPENHSRPNYSGTILLFHCRANCTNCGLLTYFLQLPSPQGPYAQSASCKLSELPHGKSFLLPFPYSCWIPLFSSSSHCKGTLWSPHLPFAHSSDPVINFSISFRWEEYNFLELVLLHH